MATVALLGPERGRVLPRRGQTIAVKRGLPVTYPSLVGPDREHAFLIVAVSTIPLGDALLRELGGNAKVVVRGRDQIARWVQEAVRKTGQEWSSVGTVELVPDKRRN